MTPEHELTAVNVCTYPDGSLKGIQFQAGIHSGSRTADIFTMQDAGSLMTDPENLWACFIDTLLDEVPFSSATVHYNQTESSFRVVALGFKYSTGEVRSYGNSTVATQSQTTEFTADSQPIGFVSTSTKDSI